MAKQSSPPPLPLHENEVARREGAEVRINDFPVRLRWVLDGLLTSDNHTLRAEFCCSVRALPETKERRLLGEVVMGRRQSLTDVDLVAHFIGGLRQVAAEQAGHENAEAWLTQAGKAPLMEAMRKSAEVTAFGCGMEVLAPFDLTLDSPTFQQQRLQTMQRAMAQQQAAGQVEQLARAAALLKKFQEVRLVTPELSAGHVLEQINPADRGSTLQTLLMASAQSAAEHLWAVAGQFLVRIDKGEASAAGMLSPKASLTPLPADLGPLRSVQAATIQGRRVLLVGARSGVMLVDPEQPREAQLYTDPTVTSQLGFNRVIYLPPVAGDRGSLVATHGDAGVVRWKVGETSAPASAIRRERLVVAGMAEPGFVTDAPTSVSVVVPRTPGPRNLEAVDEQRIIFSIGRRAFLCGDASGMDLSEITLNAESEVLAIVPDVGRLLIVHDDGAIRSFDRTSREAAMLQRQGIRLQSAGTLPWLGGTRLLLAGEQGPVLCIGSEDSLVTQYASAHRGLRAIAGSLDLVAGVSADRSRLVLWNSWDGRQPAGEIYITALTRHRIADIDFA